MPGTRARVLIVDDKPSIRTILSLVLGELGYRVRSAEDGFSALREIRQDIPEILLSDLNMPGMSGFELLSVVRRRYPAIQVILMSGSFSGKEVPSGIPADAFYQKGSSMSALLQIFRALPQMKRRTSVPDCTKPPVWNERNGIDPPGKAQVAIACGLPAGEVYCICCGSSVQYAIAEPQAKQNQGHFGMESVR
jgi:CheY-like chemotaxis protein